MLGIEAAAPFLVTEMAADLFANSHELKGKMKENIDVLNLQISNFFIMNKNCVVFTL